MCHPYSYTSGWEQFLWRRSRLYAPLPSRTDWLLWVTPLNPWHSHVSFSRNLPEYLLHTAFSGSCRAPSTATKYVSNWTFTAWQKLSQVSWNCTLRPFFRISRAFGTTRYPTMHFTLPSDSNSGKNRKSFKIQTIKCALKRFLFVYLVLKHGNTLYLTPSVCGKERLITAAFMSPLCYNFIVLPLYERVDWVSLASLLHKYMPLRGSSVGQVSQ